METAYWESTGSSEGTREPRADAPSDARVIRLDGTWRFRLSPTAAGTGDDFLSDDFDDTGWDPMRVPSHWVLEPFTPLAGGPRRSMIGTAEGPLYTNTALPIPLDPPHVSEENPTGDYRVVFEAPEDWGRSTLRFHGVDSCAKVWLNGVELGWSNGSRLPFEFEAPVRPGRNLLCVRVHRWSSGTYLEDQDMWWLPGVFREVEVIERRPGAIDDHHVRADYDHVTGVGTLRVDVRCDADAVVDIPELGVIVPAGRTVRMPVEPWSAERPRLYRGELRSAGERVELAVGFRHVEIVDGVLTVNGAPVTFRGVNRHEHHPERGRALDRETMLRDVLMMKRANVDAVRTSHYPPHPEFLRLCDEHGLWVVEECDLETHGFVYAGWEGNPPSDPAWEDGILERARRMVERDKNHPSVVIWSLANESGAGAAFRAMREWIDDRDGTRPVLYERDPRYRDSDFYSLMYPSLEQLERIGRYEEDGPEGIPAEDEARRRTLPFLLVEYAHAMGNGPGSLQDYRRIMEAHERICGGFVWEWMDHGITRTDDDGASVVLHGGDVDYEPNGGRVTLHGLVFSDRTPSPGLASLAKAYEPVRIAVGDEVVVANRRHDADTSELRFDWRWELEGRVVAAGALAVPVVEAGGSVALPAPARPEAPGVAILTVEAALAEDASWADAGHVVSWGQRVDEPSAPERPSGGSWAAPDAAGIAAGRTAAGQGAARIAVGPAELDARSGRLVSLGGVPVDGPWIDAYRAPTENDHGQGDLNDLASLWSATGMDRLLHRTDRVVHGDGWLRSEGRTAPTTHPHGLDWSMTWRRLESGVELTVDVDLSGPWTDTPFRHRDIWLPRLGLLLALPSAFGDRVAWLGRGQGESYVDSVDGCRVGWFSSSVDALQTPYPVPQENGNHVETRWLELSGAGVPTLRVEGEPLFDFTARRWTSLDLARASKPHELRDTGRVWLNLDLRQQGIGSASVGPELPERYRVPRERSSWTLRLSIG